MNKVILKGNLVADPESKTIGENKTPLCKFRLAVNGAKDSVTFLDIDTWQKTAENCGKYLKKGSPVLIEGRLAVDQWEAEGQKRSKVFVVGERVDFLGKLSDSDKTESTGAGANDSEGDDVPF